MANINGQGLMELADLISRREYNWGMARARAYEEELVKAYAEENNIEYSTLADTIEALYEKRVIGEKQRENLHNIRIIGNKAVHEEDNDPQDAKNAYYLLKEEIQAYSQRDVYEPERTPVMIRRPGTDEDDDENREAGYAAGSDDETGGIDMSYTSSRRSGGSQHQRTSSSSGRQGTVRKKKKKKSQGIDLYTILKILIPVLIVVLLIILLRSIFHGSKEEEETEPVSVETEVSTDETETEAPETTAVPETEAPETEAPATYRISGEGVNIRYADNPGQVYVQFDKGREIGTVEEFTCDNPEYAEGFAKFSYDGKELIVSKRFIEKVE